MNMDKKVAAAVGSVLMAGAGLMAFYENTLGAMSFLAPAGFFLAGLACLGAAFKDLLD